jgi:hypothetical protein
VIDTTTADTTIPPTTIVIDTIPVIDTTTADTTILSRAKAKDRIQQK